MKFGLPPLLSQPNRWFKLYRRRKGELRKFQMYGMKGATGTCQISARRKVEPRTPYKIAIALSVEVPVKYNIWIRHSDGEEGSLKSGKAHAKGLMYEDDILSGTDYGKEKLFVETYARELQEWKLQDKWFREILVPKPVGPAPPVNQGNVGPAADGGAGWSSVPSPPNIGPMPILATDLTWEEQKDHLSAVFSGYGIHQAENLDELTSSWRGALIAVKGENINYSRPCRKAEETRKTYPWGRSICNVEEEKGEYTAFILPSGEQGWNAKGHQWLVTLVGIAAKRDWLGMCVEEFRNLVHLLEDPRFRYVRSVDPQRLKS